LGIKIIDKKLYLFPDLPSDWSGYTAKIFGYDVTVERKDGYKISVNGKPYDRNGYKIKF